MFFQLSSLTIPEDQMVTVQEEIITTADNETLPPKHEPEAVIEEVMDEGDWTARWNYLLKGGGVEFWNLNTLGNP